MKNLNTLQQYNELYAKITRIVNETDPCSYCGPEDEYDSYVNHLLRLIRDHKINIDNFNLKLKEIFFDKDNIDPMETEEFLLFSKLLQDELKGWI